MFVLADPVGHLRAPTMLNDHFSEAGIDVAVLPLHVRSGDIERVLSGLRRMQNLAGFGVTIPHKVAIAGFLDGLTPRARMIGAVNYVRREADGRLCGENVDGAGFVRGLALDGVSVAGKRVLQVGAGGAGRAVAFAIAESGAAALTIANRAVDRADALARAVAAAFPACRTARGEADPRGFDIVVNTTSLGMGEGEPMPVDAAIIAPETVVAEVVMMPEVTPLLAAAAARGSKTVVGRRMMEGQIELMMAFLGLGGPRVGTRT